MITNVVLSRLIVTTGPRPRRKPLGLAMDRAIRLYRLALFRTDESGSGSRPRASTRGTERNLSQAALLLPSSAVSAGLPM